MLLLMSFIIFGSSSFLGSSAATLPETRRKPPRLRKTSKPFIAVISLQKRRRLHYPSIRAAEYFRGIQSTWDRCARESRKHEKTKRRMSGALRPSLQRARVLPFLRKDRT